VDRSDRNRGLLSGAVALDRRQFLRGVAATGAVAGAGGLLAACSSSSSTTKTSTASTAPKHGGNLKVGLSGSDGADTLDPHNQETYLDGARALALYESLAQLNNAGQMELVLAESITANSATEWIIKLRQGITFHSGKPLTAQDVIYTFRRIKTGNNGGPFPGGNSLGPMDLKGLKALDTHTVKVPFTSPYASFYDQLAYWYFQEIIPDGFNPAAKGAKPDGTGPFMYQSFTPEQRSVFVKNPHYWKPGQPYVDSLTIIDFPDTTSLQDALTTGVVHAAGGFDGPQLAALSSQSGVKTLASHTGAITPFTMRVDKPPFNDVRVRQAMRLLVNRPQLIDSALDGYGVVANDVFSPYDPDFDSSLHREQDIPQAKALLKAAGQEDLTVTLVTSAVATGTVAMATVLAEQAKAAGVTINLNNISPATFFSPKSYLVSDFSQDYYGYSPYLAQVAQCMLGSMSPFNETHTDSPTLNRLYAQANSELNPATRKQIEYEMQVWDFNNGGYIIPAYIDSLDAYSDKLTGYSAAAAGQPLSNFDFQNWSFT
jgi:peptide/nickel transport system substrate-binding protein